MSTTKLVPTLAGAWMIAFGLSLSHCLATDNESQDGQVEVISNSIDMKLAEIPAGTFVMGSPKNETDRDNKEIQHRVTISKPFYIGVHEVTQAQYTEVMKGQDFNNPSVFKENRGGGPEHPVENVEWKLAKEFCKRLSARDEEEKAGRSYRLPSEAEWEYACRGGTTTAFHFGESLSARDANFNGNFPSSDAEKGPYLRKTAKVGSYEPNAFGLHDMHGNVA